ncbi:hypothetical protein Dsin_012276 [Dipteronia sinensis]|uniref:MADS-box domain-containing protein n=1 Tax=Dipteronia sinensis TaxID=43782 RepID=A0AAE0AHR6_9ROSI|nr:hypothetical protein Dsin_012276 [Dipteronia sinensis]
MDKEIVNVEANKQLKSHGKSLLATFKKRKVNLLKKAGEINILCGVDLCMIIFGPNSRDGPSRPETWASKEVQLINIINRYKEVTEGVNNHAQRASSSSAFHENSVGEIAKMGNIDINGKFSTWDPRFDKLSEDQLRLITGKVVVKLNAAARKLRKMKRGENVVKRDDSNKEHLNNNKVLNLVGDVSL